MNLLQYIEHRAAYCRLLLLRVYILVRPNFLCISILPRFNTIFILRRVEADLPGVTSTLRSLLLLGEGVKLPSDDNCCNKCQA